MKTVASDSTRQHFSAVVCWTAASFSLSFLNVFYMHYVHFQRSARKTGQETCGACHEAWEGQEAEEEEWVEQLEIEVGKNPGQEMSTDSLREY